MPEDNEVTGVEEQHESQEKQHKCPECGETFEYATGLGSHRRIKHRVSGTSPSTLAYQMNKDNPDYKCPECHRVFVTKSGLGIHRFNSHGIAGASNAAQSRLKATAGKKIGRPKGIDTKLKPKAKNGIVVHRAKRNDTDAGVDHAITGYAIAKLESLAEKIARDNGLPEKEFVRSVAILFAGLMAKSS